MTTFHVFKRHNGKYYYRLIAASGHNLVSSDGYASRSDCLGAIEQLKMLIRRRGHVELNETTGNKWKFLVAGTDRSIIGYSMLFNTRKQCIKWVDLLKEFLPKAETMEIAS